MDIVHVFVSTGRFRSLAEVRAFVEPAYIPDGDAEPSAFAREVGQSEYEPGCIECVHRPAAVPLPELLAGSSYGGWWLPRLPAGRRADAAVCVFPPNRIARPADCSLEYVGPFAYRAEQGDG